MHVLMLVDEAATALPVAGGKGASLARLVQAGFPVPPGFVVTTDGFTEFFASTGLDEAVARRLATVDYSIPADIEAATDDIRAAVVAAPIPDTLAKSIVQAYHGLGAGVYVAVRSSGTAEDLADASFAGQHDTYLDIHGEESLLDAVRRCWASLFTARATSYRQQGGFEHGSVRLAVVVQAMVPAEVAGVMFTANPMTAAVDELVVNASWGLGEGVVSGLVTPDQFSLDRETLRVKERILGTKAERVVRAPRGDGVVHEEVSAALRTQYSLSDRQLTELGQLGRRVSEYYGDWPQDIEWAFADGALHLLQSRDITGVPFSWDEDLEDYTEVGQPIAGDAILSRGFADEVWNGRVTPLCYSMRAEWLARIQTTLHELYGVPELNELRFVKYHRGEVYVHCEAVYRGYVARVPKAVRSPGLLIWTPEPWKDRLAQESGASWLTFVRALTRTRLLDPDINFFRMFAFCHAQIEERGEEALGLTPAEIRALSDRELQRYVNHTIKAMGDWCEDLWLQFFFVLPTVVGTFNRMLAEWAGVTNPMTFSDLVTGLPRTTWVTRENAALWEQADRIRRSEPLLQLFREHRDGDFFAACENLPEGREFLAGYRDFLAHYGHRGHADRDTWYPRRAEDPSIDYRTFAAFLAMDHLPSGAEERLMAQRLAVTEEILAAISQQPLGRLKAEAFKVLHKWLLDFFVLRDDERFHSDRFMFAKKQAVKELGRRLAERGVLDGADDFYYLSKTELFALLDGRINDLRVTKAKVSARRENCERADTVRPPMYIYGNGTVAHDLDRTEVIEPAGGVLRGLGTSRGTVVGTARIIPRQEELDRLQKGDILVCRSTDPGWTTAFLIASGAVFETGGLLAHCSCISREYGLPAVQVIDAMALIEDGATIEVNGDTGEVRVLDVAECSG